MVSFLILQVISVTKICFDELSYVWDVTFCCEDRYHLEVNWVCLGDGVCVCVCMCMHVCMCEKVLKTKEEN